MRKSLFLFLLIAACGTAKTTTVTPPPVVVVHPEPIKIDTIHKIIAIQDTIRIPNTGSVDIRSFGAKVDGITDDIIADSTACAFCIANPKTCSEVIFPVGHSRITRPLILSNNGNQFTIHIKGMYPAKEASDGYLSQIICDYKAGPGIGIINGRGIVIENLSIIGKYTFPYSVTNSLIGTLKFSDWVDPTIPDSKYAPYSGITIDPYAGYAGTSGVEIRQCAIKQFMVGIALSPNQSTVNDEMINIIDCDIEAVRVAIAIGQDQSKTISITGLKVWASVLTVLDGIHYGRGTGGGSVFCENWNIAGNCNELFDLNTDRFPLSAKDIYSESLFRIGNVGNGVGANFINFQIDFLTGAGLPAADYLIAGQANLYGGMLRYYDNQGNHRMNLSNFGGSIRDMTLNNQPIIAGLYGSAIPVPIFDNVHNYYHSGYVNDSSESLYFFHTTPTLIVDRNKWTATITVPTNFVVQVGDYILASPASTTRTAYDPDINPGNIATIQIGRVVAINGAVLSLDDVGINAYSGIGYDGLYLNRLK
jgi:hypothetical protein